MCTSFCPFVSEVLCSCLLSKPLLRINSLQWQSKVLQNIVHESRNLDPVIHLPLQKTILCKKRFQQQKSFRFCAKSSFSNMLVAFIHVANRASNYGRENAKKIMIMFYSWAVLVKPHNSFSFGTVIIAINFRNIFYF